jgi:two-component system, OmpR family, response regulator
MYSGPTDGLAATALLVDVDEGFAARLGSRLRAEGWRVVVSVTAGDAIDACRRHAVDVVIASSRLPDATGPDLCREVRAVCDSPVVLLSDDEPWAARMSLLEHGADVCVERPSDLRLLLAQVRAVVRGSAHRLPTADRTGPPARVDAILRRQATAEAPPD